jgi:cadmium resistance protein CadD (predicted permease)
VPALLSRALTAVGVFAATNVDDLVVLTVLFLACRASGQPKAWQVWTGQYLGMAALVAFSGVAALGLAVVPDRWVFLLGLVPVGLGVWGVVSVVRARQGGDRGDANAALPSQGALSVALATIANGADNISVYTPLFRTSSRAENLVTLTVFTLMVAGWCRLGDWSGSHRRIVALVDRAGPWLVPVVFILIGAWILLGSSGLWSFAS